MIKFTQFLIELYFGTDVPKQGGGKTLPVLGAKIKKSSNTNTKSYNPRQNEWPTGRSEESSE